MKAALKASVPIALALAATAWGIFAPPVLQSQDYHRFADARAFAGLANAADTLSNLAFVFVGVLGLAFLWREHASGSRVRFATPREIVPYWVFFAGVALTSAGSAWYHLAPDDARLVWDRLPMTVGFMALLAAIVAERVSVTAGIVLLPALLVLGAGSLAYWYAGELGGAGDLRPYALVQFVPAALIPLMLWLFPARYTHGAYVVGVIAIYGAAKLFEALDAPIYSVGHLLSGHTLKHLTAALAAWWLLRGLDARRPAAAEERT